MKKRCVALLILLSVLITIPAYAVSPRVVNIVPDITFSGGTAICTAVIMGNNSSDPISATMILKRGFVVLGTWRDSAEGILNLQGTAAVSAGDTCTLTVNATINGRAYSPVTIQETNN